MLYQIPLFPSRCSPFGALSKDEVTWDMTVGAADTATTSGSGTNKAHTHTRAHTLRSHTIDVAKPDFLLMRSTDTDTFSRISWEKGNPGAGGKRDECGN